MLNPYNEIVRARLGRPDTSTVVRAVLAFAALGALTACHPVQAKTPAPTVALNMPPPPPRVTIPVTLPEPEPDPPPAPPIVPPDAPARGRGASPPRPAENRPPSAPPTAAAPPSVVDPPPSPVLRTTPDTEALEQKTNALINEAQQNLDRVNRKDISVQARAQYDSARSFIQKARDAMKIKNYNYAEAYAAKAVSLAKELVKG